MDPFVLTPYENTVDPTTNDDGEKIQFKFGELTESAQQHALKEARRDPSNDWWDSTFECVKQDAKYLGIDIDTRWKYVSADISFSGFCSQGDGACFNGHLDVMRMQDAIRKVDAEKITGELRDFAVRAKDIYDSILAEEIARRIISNGDDHQLYWVDTNSVLTIFGKQSGCFTTKIDEDNLENIEAFENILSEFVDDFAAYIYDMLEREYEHLTSDEYVIQEFEDTDVLFDEFGATL